MIPLIKRTLTPGCYHGNPGKAPFFEGWYYKCVDAAADHVFAVIPGIVQSKKNPHAFIQIFNGKTGQSFYIPYPVEKFNHLTNQFDIRIANNHFTENYCELDIQHGELNCSGHLEFANIKPWPVRLRSPGIMGWYAWVPFMECFHGVLSMDHRIQGKLQINDESIDFTNGRGYIEKDWGQAFPQAWFWMQSNHFSTTGTSLTGSLAIIPWIKHPFPGFIFGVLHDGVLFKFTTWNGTKITKLSYEEPMLELVLENKKHLLRVKAVANSSSELIAPSLDGMTRTIQESLNAVIRIKLVNKKSNAILIDDESENSGFEAAGNLEQLKTIWKNAQ